MLAASIVHEFMHPFGDGTSDDHYWTERCKQQMGWSEGDWVFALEDAQAFNGLSPYLYAAFDRGYQP